MSADEVVEHNGIVATTVARTLLDLAAVLPPTATRRAVAQSDVLGRFDRHEVVRLLQRHPRHRGAQALRDLLRVWEEPERDRSELERLFVRRCERFGFPRPVLNSTILGMEIDAVFPDQRIAVELDGYRFHSGAVQWENDHEKRARLVAADWTVLAYSWRQVRDDDGAFVRRTLGPLLARTLHPLHGPGS